MSNEQSITLAPYQVIMRPLVTEKNVRAAEKQNQYAFEVHKLASKEDVKRAVEELFNVKVAKVRTQSRLGKTRRHKMRAVQTRSWKKAVVKLLPDFRIDFF